MLRPRQVERIRQADLMDRIFEMKDAGRVSTDELAEHPGRHLMSTRSGYWKREGCAMRE